MFRFGLGIALLVLILDQASKWWILTDVMSPRRILEITPFLNIVLVWNRGVSFGLFNTGSALVPWILTAVSLAIAIGLGLWLRRVDQRLVAAGLGLIMGGALGNVVDRVRFRAVIDFVDVHVSGYHWPAFNVADSAIVIGVGLLIFESLFSRADSPK